MRQKQDNTLQKLLLLHQNAVEFGHPSGTLKVGAVIKKGNGKFIVDKATMSRSARIIMKGEVYAPAEIME